jgi:hypothetical protein
MRLGFRIASVRLIAILLCLLAASAASRSPSSANRSAMQPRGARSYTLDGWISSQQVLRRIGRTNHYLAARWIYLDLDSRFDTGQEQPVLSDHERARRASGIGLSWEYDSRDTIFTPSRGLLAAIETLSYDPSWGADTSFETWRAYLYWYTPIGRSVVLGTRLDGRTARGDVPFYAVAIHRVTRHSCRSVSGRERRRRRA